MGFFTKKTEENEEKKSLQMIAMEYNLFETYHNEGDTERAKISFDRIKSALERHKSIYGTSQIPDDWLDAFGV